MNWKLVYDCQHEIHITIFTVCYSSLPSKELNEKGSLWSLASTKRSRRSRSVLEKWVGDGNHIYASFPNIRWDTCLCFMYSVKSEIIIMWDNYNYKYIACSQWVITFVFMFEKWHSNLTPNHATVMDVLLVSFLY